MQNYRKIFSEGLNADDDFSVITKGQWVNASNIRTFTTDKGATGRVEAVGGNTVLFNTLPAGSNKCIGGVADESKKRIVFFNWNSNGDNVIYCYDKLAATTYTALTNAQVEGGLNFSKYSRISSNAKLIGNLLQFTDDLNEIKCINLEAGIKLNHSGYSTDVEPYTSPLKYTTTTLIKRPPIFPVTWQKIFDGSFANNFVADSVFQPTYRYRYRDNQVSALASYGKIIPYNADADNEADNFNRIDFTIPITEKIDDDVFAVDLCVKLGNLGKTFIIKSWDKDSDADAITDHNDGTPLSFSFFNDTNGEVLDDVVATTSFDPVPLLSKTLELAEFRTFLGNNKLGYNTPFSTSLALTVGTYDTGGAGTFTVAWKYIEIPYSTIGSGGGIVGDSQFYYAYYSDGGLYTAYFWDSLKDEITGPSGTLDSTTATTRWNTEANLMEWIKINYNPPSGNEWEIGGTVNYFDTGFTASLLIPSDVGDAQFFKSNSTYKVSIAFYDRFRRKCGVVKDYKQVTIPVRTYDQSVFSATVDWALSNTDALTEIPDWAYYYQIHITRNQTTRFFEQINSPKSSYVTKAVDGTLTYNQTTFAINTNYATSFDLTQLISNGLGYTFNEGDQLIVYKTDGSARTIPILETDGSNVLVKPIDLGDLTLTTAFIIEIYTPYKTNLIEPYYETGSVYPITNPGTTSRAYSSLSGEINGDCYAIMRDKGGSNLYFCEVMSPNDKFWKDWQTDTGWPNTVDTIGQKTLTNSIVFSDTFIQGTKVNGLNKFQPLNETDLGAENGAIQKLQLANKVQSDGTVMLAICEEETVSMYLGEQELFDAQGNSFIVKSDSVIGKTRSLQGSMGTSNPESVFEYNGQVFWWDTRNACAVQYSTNGLFPISKKKFVRPAKLFSKKFVSLTTEQIEALGSDPYIIGGFDPYHKEVLFSIPSTETPPKGYLADFPSIIYPYDIYDGQGKTLVYKHEADVWFGSMSFQSEFFVKMDNDLYSFKDGALWIHNQSNLCNFYGTQYKANLMFSNNPGAIHTFLSIGLESNKIPSWVHLRTEDPYTQSSDLPYPDYAEFKNRQGVLECSLMRDRLSPNTTGDYDLKELRGDRLIGKALLTMLEYEFEEDTTALELRIVDIGHNINTGTLINK